jgi:hypothetical protein
MSELTALHCEFSLRSMLFGPEARVTIAKISGVRRDIQLITGRDRKGQNA